MEDEFRPFVIEVRRPWLLWILPILAALYFLAVVLLAVLDLRIRGVSNEMLALAGVGFFVLVMLVEVPFLFRRRAPTAPKAAKPRKEKAAPPTEVAASGAPMEDELLTTDESQQGLQVLEYSAPPKSANPNVVYTKTYVPVTKEHVVRVETAVADTSDV